MKTKWKNKKKIKKDEIIHGVYMNDLNIQSKSDSIFSKSIKEKPNK